MHTGILGIRSDYMNFVEESIEIGCSGRILRGIQTRPVQGQSPVVIIYHGFCGSKIGPHFIFVRLARELAKQGIASVRFDFYGSGESDGVFSDMTLSTEIEDAKLIYEWASKREYVERNNKFLLGLSMGGLITSLIAPDYDDINSIVLWSPAGNMLQVAEESAKNAFYTSDGYADIEGLLINKEFINDLRKYDIYNTAKNYKKSALIIHGTKDEVVPIEFGKKYKVKYGEKSKFIEVKGADHVFQRSDWKGTVIRETTKYIKLHIAKS